MMRPVSCGSRIAWFDGLVRGSRCAVSGLTGGFESGSLLTNDWATAASGAPPLMRKKEEEK